jgi:hypothetical protein
MPSRIASYVEPSSTSLPMSPTRRRQTAKMRNGILNLADQSGAK